MPKGIACGVGGLWVGSWAPADLWIPGFAAGFVGVNFAWNSIVNDLKDLPGLPPPEEVYKMVDEYDPATSQLLPGNMLSDMIKDQTWHHKDKDGHWVSEPIPMVTRNTHKGPPVTMDQWVARERGKYPQWDGTETEISAD